MDLLNLYGRASEWTLEKVAGATAKLDVSTPCDKWTVRDLLNHILETQQFFVSTARNEGGQPPAPKPAELLSDSPVDDFEHARAQVLSTFSEDGVIARTGPSLGIAFSDQLLHGWDVAKATGQDTTMPHGLAEAAHKIIHGRFTDEERKGIFGSEITVPTSASAKDTLLAYTGRNPSR
jgi:uncharacterized protein (TIGR03086 family)